MAVRPAGAQCGAGSAGDPSRSHPWHDS